VRTAGEDGGRCWNEVKGRQWTSRLLTSSIPFSSGMATNPATIRQRKVTAAVTPTPALIHAAADSPAPSPPPSFYSIILKMLYVLPFFYVAYYLATYQWFPRPPLPDSYAVCSAWGSQPQIHTLDANNTVAECVVVSHGRVVHTGTLESVRRGYGDDSAQDGGIGVWITRLKRGQMLIPGLCVPSALWT
jgi:hypothetical protein